ncbi:MAG: hydrolase [Patiriisocius sp.]|uniref:hydrolase n=1 Tax=Patiriisocius sp. TaxID=2822396 RepID=UPI003EF31540
MRKSIFMYLFFFAVLFILFQYANEKSIFENQEKKINILTEKLEKSKSEIDSLSNIQIGGDYFKLQGNDNAMEYIERLGLDATKVEQMVSDKIYDQNGAPNGNPLIEYKGAKGNMRFNKLKFLNHRWIIADFSDGQNWGEMIIEYFFDENNELTLTPVSSLLYSSN